jgi:hypothetical protein
LVLAKPHLAGAVRPPVEAEVQRHGAHVVQPMRLVVRKHGRAARLRTAHHGPPIASAVRALGGPGLLDCRRRGYYKPMRFLVLLTLQPLARHANAPKGRRGLPEAPCSCYPRASTSSRPSGSCPPLHPLVFWLGVFASGLSPRWRISWRAPEPVKPNAPRFS